MFKYNWMKTSRVIVTCLMLLVMNQTRKMRDDTWTPVTITEVLTIPAAEQEEIIQPLTTAEVTARKQIRHIHIDWHIWLDQKEKSSHTDGTMSHL